MCLMETPWPHKGPASKEKLVVDIDDLPAFVSREESV